MSQGINEQSEAILREGLPPHLAEICIDAMNKSAESGWLLSTPEDAGLSFVIGNNICWGYFQFPFADLDACCQNGFHAESFYARQPSYRPTEAPAEGNEAKGVTGDEPFELTVDEMIDAHLPIRESELQQVSNAEDKRDPDYLASSMHFQINEDWRGKEKPMHSNEPPEVSTDMVMRQMAKDLPVYVADIHTELQRAEREIVETKIEGRQGFVNDHGLRVMYQEYNKWLSPSWDFFDDVMRVNPDKSLSMYTFEEFRFNYNWVMPLLSLCVQRYHNSIQKGLIDGVAARVDKLGNQQAAANAEASNAHIESRLHRSNQKMATDSLLKDKEKTHKAIDGTNTIVVVVGFFVLVDIVIHIVKFFIK